MRLVAIGVVTGFFLGASVSAGAQSVGDFFYKVSEIRSRSTDLKLGYAAGVFDTINKLARDGVQPGKEISTQKVVKIAACLNGYASPNLGAFSAWVSTVYPKYRSGVSAASAILSECL
jgi:hypothetical protein